MGFHYTEKNTTNEVDVITIRKAMAAEEAALTQTFPTLKIMCEVAENFLYAITNTKEEEDAKDASKHEHFFPRTEREDGEAREMSGKGDVLRHPKQPTYFADLSRKFPELRIKSAAQPQEKKSEPEPIQPDLLLDSATMGGKV